MIDGGMGSTHVNTFLSALNVPHVRDNLLKRCERKIGPAIETRAKESCVESIQTERSMEQALTASDDNAMDVDTGESTSQSPCNSSSAQTENDNNDSSTGSNPPTASGTNTTTSPMSNIVREQPQAASTPHPESRVISTDSTITEIVGDGPVSTGDQVSSLFKTPQSLRSDMKSVRVPIKGSVDAAWQRRGSARSYNSKTGHSSLVGHNSRKILGYTTRKKGCRKCSKGHKPSDHDCRQNHSKSSKAMEPDMAVELICRNAELEKENVFVNVLIGDDDSSTEAAVRRESIDSFEKWSDTNHATKALTSALYGNGVPQQYHDYFRKNFGYGLKQNKGDAEGVKRAILSIPKHAFGDHSICGSWCDGPGHVHKGLPGGKPLGNTSWKGKLGDIFNRLARNATKLAPCGSSQANESFNSVVCSKHPKSRYYGDSESIDYRVAAAVCQKNVGTKFVVDVNRKLGLSPGQETKKFRIWKDKMRCRQSSVRMSTEFKKGRQILKKLRKQKESGVERKEGVTYLTECGLDGVGQLPDEPVVSNLNRRKPHNSDCVVIFDLETTGFGKTAEICQIAAVSMNTDESFSTYILPSKPINPKASDVTKLTVSNGLLYHDGLPVATFPPRISICNFFEYLKKQGKSVVLVAHNCFTFDAPKICQQVSDLGLMDKFKEIVSGFSDTLPILKGKLDERKREKKSFKLSELAKDILGIATDEAHNAVWDVKVLKDIVNTVDVPKTDLISSSKSVVDITHRGAIKQQTADHLLSLQGNIGTAMSGLMLKRMAAVGLTFDKLLDVYKCHGEKGVTNVLSEDVNGHPKVTKSKKIIQSLVSVLQKKL